MRRFITVLTGLLIAGSSLLAMPPNPGLLQQVHSGRLAVPYAMTHRAQLFRRGVDNPTSFPPVHRGELDDVDYNTLLLLLDFDDNEHHVDPAMFDSLLYGSSFSTVKNFYNTVSYGTFHVMTDDYPSTIGWIHMPHPYAWYVNGNNGYGDFPQNVQGMVTDAVTIADTLVDFRNYDNDGDGEVDGLLICHAGPGAELTGSPDMIWSHSWQIPGVTLDSVEVRRYTIMPEYWNNYGDMTCGVYCHEMGHMIFGLPDLYDTDYTSSGIGDWSLMAGGSWGGTLGDSPAEPDAWSRIFMGFAEPVVVTVNSDSLAIPNVEEAGYILKLQTEVMDPSEYFLVENRRQTGYDSSLPGQGLLVYHVDDREDSNTNEWYPGHEHSGHYWVAVEQADGQFALEQNISSGDPGDPYPGTTDNHSFDAGTTPNSLTYTDLVTNIGLENISAAADTMHADVLVQPLPAPVNLADSVSFGDGQVFLTWEMNVPAGTVSQYNVFRDGTPIGTATDMAYTDTMPTVGGHYIYSVSAVWPGGESRYNPTVEAWWPTAIAPSGLSYNVVDPEARIIDVQWQALRGDSVRIDDGTADRFCNLSSTIHDAQLINRLTMPSAGWIKGVRFYTEEAGTFTFGQVRMEVYAGASETSPGVRLYQSDIFTPDHPGWNGVELGDQAIQVQEGEDIWVQLDWVETGHTRVGCDTTTARAHRSFVAINGGSYESTDTWLGGAFSGNLMIRADLGREENPGQLGLDHFEVYRNSTRIDSLTETSYQDTLPEAVVYSYTVSAIYAQGTAVSDVLSVDGSTLSAPESAPLPLSFSIGAAYPNPFNPSVSVPVTLARTAPVRMQVYDLLGRRVADLRPGKLATGRHTLSWSAHGAASGVYFLRIQAGKVRTVRKVVLMR